MSDVPARPGDVGDRLILRVLRHERDFTIVGNAVLRDERLSFKALGVLVAALSYPADWAVRAETLARSRPASGRDGVRAALTELEDAGYVLRKRYRMSDGRVGTQVLVAEDPALLDPYRGDEELAAGAGNPGPGDESETAGRTEDGSSGAGSTGAGSPGPGSPAPENPASYKDGLTKDGYEERAEPPSIEPAALALLALSPGAETDEWDAAHAVLVEDFGEPAVVAEVERLASRGIRTRWARHAETRVRQRLGAAATAEPPRRRTATDWLAGPGQHYPPEDAERIIADEVASGNMTDDRTGEAAA